jgi:hypothetical protein
VFGWSREQVMATVNELVARKRLIRNAEWILRNVG